MKLLVVEDEEKTAAYLKKGLSENHFVVDTCRNGEEALDLVHATPYALLILDVMLPGRDGWSILSELRERGNQTPVLFLSALSTVGDKVKGLGLGADDYLIKPFSFAELLARVRSVLRRGPVRRPDVIRAGDLEIDLPCLRATRAGQRLDLTPKEFRLLSLMARRPGEVFSRSVLADRVWDMNFDSDTNVVDVHIRRLRSKLDDPFATKLIHTVRGLGYVFESR